MIVIPVDYATTTTTTTATTAIVAPRLNFDPSYAKTFPGILKIVKMVLDLCGFICIMAADFYTARGRFFSFVSMTSFSVMATFLLNYILHFVERTPSIPWLFAEFIFNSLWTFFYLVISSLVADYGARYINMESYAAAAFFGFAAMIVHGVDAFLKFRAWRNNELAQGERVVSSPKYEPQTSY